MTRGAVYHHFKNKKDLFLAVLEQIQIDTGKYIEEKANLSNDPWEQLILGCIAFIEFATLSENSRILLIDAPNIIGWTEWKKSDENNSEFYLKEHLSLLKQEGILIVRKRFPLIIRILSTFIQLFCWMLLRSIDMLQSKIKKRHLKG